MWWIIGIILVAVAGVSTWFAFHSPTFVARLTAFAASKAWKAIASQLPKLLKPASAEKLEQVHRDKVSGVERTITGRERIH